MLARRFVILVGLAAVLLTGCTHYATVAEKRPRFMRKPSAMGLLANAEAGIARALRLGRSQPLVALGEYLDAADVAYQHLSRNPGDTVALHDYNFAISRVFETIRNARLDPWTHPLQVPSAGGGFTLTHKPDPRPQWKPNLYNFTPADEFDIRGSYVMHRTTKDGIGAPLVAIGKEPVKDYRKTFSLSRVCYGVTAVARFEPGRRCVIEFIDPLASETIPAAGHQIPLAGDFTVPLAVMLVQEHPQKLELARLLRPDKYEETAHITRLQPYDPNKTVVLVTHGLRDSPATWTPMFNTLRGDPHIRANFQFWFYSYPSGYPYPYSAAILRRELDAAIKLYHVRKPMVLVGHSMGGLISRLMITDTGDKVWLKVFGTPPERTKLSPLAHRMLREALIFQHRREVGRVVFIATPHRGSRLASNWLGRLGARLVKAPTTLAKIGVEMKNIMAMDRGALKLNRLPNSVDTLAPNNRFVRAINTVPPTPGIPYHSIIGDRGRGDSPNSSDGFVKYESSHLNGVQSECIVPSGHSAHQNEQAIAELRRILLLHAGHRGQ